LIIGAILGSLLRRHRFRSLRCLAAPKLRSAIARPIRCVLLDQWRSFLIFRRRLSVYLADRSCLPPSPFPGEKSPTNSLTDVGRQGFCYQLRNGEVNGLFQPAASPHAHRTKAPHIRAPGSADALSPKGKKRAKRYSTSLRGGGYERHVTGNREITGKPRLTTTWLRTMR